MRWLILETWQTFLWRFSQKFERTSSRILRICLEAELIFRNSYSWESFLRKILLKAWNSISVNLEKTAAVSLLLEAQNSFYCNVILSRQWSSDHVGHHKSRRAWCGLQNMHFDEFQYYEKIFFFFNTRGKFCETFPNLINF